jgi:mRNA-degrading endonuclease RelE of RelBE toxin-antitoxin system
MDKGFRTVATPGFQRDVRDVTKHNPHLLATIEHLLDILEHDPFNTGHQQSIKKLTNVKAGSGQWRIRAGKYRLRYDIIGRDVILYSFRHRKAAY